MEELLCLSQNKRKSWNTKKKANTIRYFNVYIFFNLILKQRGSGAGNPTVKK
jgi:hypothetical protein